MNKREMIHALIDRIMDIEETSKKSASVNYLSHVGLDFRFYESKDSGALRVRPSVDFYTSGWKNLESQFNHAMKELDLIQNTPDVEPRISVTIEKSKAIELGLIQENIA